MGPSARAHPVLPGMGAGRVAGSAISVRIRRNSERTSRLLGLEPHVVDPRSKVVRHLHLRPTRLPDLGLQRMASSRARSCASTASGRAGWSSTPLPQGRNLLRDHLSNPLHVLNKHGLELHAHAGLKRLEPVRLAALGLRSKTPPPPLTVQVAHVNCKSAAS